VPSDLVELWNAKSAEQKAVLRLCAAVRDDDAGALKVRTTDCAIDLNLNLASTATKSCGRALFQSAVLLQR